MKTNPYEVLQLDPSATEAEIIQQAGRLRQRAVDDESLTEIRQAVQALTASAEERQLQSLLSHARPVYSWETITQLAQAFRRPPVCELESTQGDKPFSLDLEAVAEVLRALLAEELRPEAIPFVLPPIEEMPEEIDRQTVEGIWQSLLYDPRG